MQLLLIARNGLYLRGNDMKKMSVLFISFVAIILFTVPSSFGCECGRVAAPDTKKWLKESDGAIFAGEVIKIEIIEIPLPDRPDSFYLKKRVTFKVSKGWKNADSDEITVFTGIGGGDCGIRFVKDEKYLVDAYKISGKLETGICSATQK
ncbi:MAG: hypothetical protein ABI977_34975, partial [Acidobacteriota bacterium]